MVEHFKGVKSYLCVPISISNYCINPNSKIKMSKGMAEAAENLHEICKELQCQIIHIYEYEIFISKNFAETATI